VNFLERLYYAGFLMKQHYSLAHRERLPCRVISVGNITVGGTGKTPAIMAMAQQAIARGYRPVILTRGYKGTATGPCFVTRGDGPLLSVGEAGDEPFLIADRLHGVPIVKGPDRYESGVFALSRLGDGSPEFISRTLFLLDDGFQHAKLWRDLDIVLIDSDDPFGGGRLLPFGRLREPASSLQRAGVIVITKTGARMGERGPAVEKIINAIREHNTSAPLFIADHLPVSCTGKLGEPYPVNILAGKRVSGFCGIGNPESFRKTLADAGAEVTGLRHYRDHHRYTSADIAEIKREASALKSEWIVTTEKDIIKIRHLDLPENILIIRIEFSADSSLYDKVFM